MPHYNNCDQAFVGDGVVGRGYNRLPHNYVGGLANPERAVLVGRIVSVTPGSESCNCQVVAVEVFDEPAQEDDKPLHTILGQWFTINNAQGKPVRVRIVHDYSDCKQFFPVDGEMQRARSEALSKLR